MLWAASLGALELRSEGGATRLRASFPYGAETELAPGLHEIIAPRAFSNRIDHGEDIYLLAGHDFEKPLASRAAGNLTLTDAAEALVIEATIDPNTTWARDFLAAHKAGLIRGLSPGFRVAPGGERIESRGDVLVRTVIEAALFEVSAVTRPAYDGAQIEARCWQPIAEPAARVVNHLNRWRL